MTLSEQDATHFYQLMAGLQFFAAQQLEIEIPATTIAEYREIRGQLAMDVRNAVWENPALITRYAETNPDKLSDEECAIIGRWTQFVSGRFTLERHLKKYSVFLGNDKVYAVIGLYDEIERMVPKPYLPRWVNCVLLPFKGHIIYDGLLSSYNMIIGRNMASGFKDEYMRAKRKGEIIFSFNEDIQATTEAKNKVNLKDWRPELNVLSEQASKLRAQTGSPPTWSPAFGLVKSALRFAELAVESPEDVGALIDEYNKLIKLTKRLDKAIDRL